MLKVRLLGQFIVELDGQAADIPSRPAQSLLAYLILNAGIAQRREKVAGLLWPESTEANARSNLRHALWRLRKALGKSLQTGRDYFDADDITIAFDATADYWLDTAVLDRKADESWSADELIEAVSVHQGELLPGFYDEWVSLERERLQAVFEHKMQLLLERLVEAGRWSEILEWGERWIALGHMPEPAYRALMVAHSELGDLSSVAAVFQRCVEALREELGVEPSQQTKDLYERIIAGDFRAGVIERRERVIRGYELRERIGTGGFGVVYRAYQPAVGRDVAIKVILPEYANHPDFIRRFEAEAQLVARLEHLHIVPLYDYWREPDGAYLVMRWLRGGNLREALQRGPWAPEAAARLLDQVAGALAVAHRQGVVHRDVKPENILLDKESNGYLSDFGIAKDLMRTTGVTETGAGVGSPAYGSPEQAQGRSITPQSDLYSLGVVMYQVLTGEHPFPGVTPAEQLVKHLTEPLPPLRERRPELPETLEEVMRRATAKDPADRFSEAQAFARAFREAISDVAVEAVAPPLDWVPLEMVNPYKGLRAFEEADAADFFGREALTKQLLARLGEEGDPSTGSGQEAARFLAVVGPSGSGKSSVVKAGLIPALRQGALPGSEDWLIVETFPGAHPLEELEAALLRVAVNPPPSLIEQLKDEHGLLRAVKRTLPPGDFDLLLMIDQFEELFTLVDDEAVRRHLMGSLLAAVADPRSRLRVVVTLRADFYDRPLRYAEFGELLCANMETVMPLSSAELEQAIRGPAERVGANLEAGLVAAIVAEVNEQPGALPMLQYALTELFERREGPLLTREAYHAVGGVSGALARRAEEVYAELDEAAQKAARQLFLRLITLGEGVEDTRRRVLRSELMAMQTLGVAEGPRVLDAVIEAFGQSRLLLFDRDPATRAPTLEVAHEALLREWGRLSEWLDESRADVRMQRILGNSAAEWLRAEHDPSFLLRGSRLNQFEGWAQETDLALTGDERAYLEASVARREQERRASERRRNLTIGLAVGVAIVMAILGLFSFRQSQEARTAQLETERQARIGRARELAARAQAEDDPTGSLNLMLAREAALVTWLADGDVITRPFVTNEAVAALHFAVDKAWQLPWRMTLPWRQRLTESVVSVAYSPDGSRIVSASNDGTMRVWDAETGQELTQLTGHIGIVYSMAYSPDGSRIVGGSSDGTVRVWDAETGRELTQLTGHTRRVNSVAYSPDGSHIVSGADDGMVRVWDAKTGQALTQLTGHTGWVSSVAYSPDGSRIVSSGMDQTVWVWNAETGQALIQLTGHTGWVSSVAYSPDGAPGGDRIVSGSSDRTVRVWDAETGQALTQLTGHTGRVSSVVYSPDGSRIVGGSEYGTVWVWDAETGQALTQLTGHTGSVNSAAYSPDGSRIVSGGSDGTVRVWDAETRQALTQLIGHTGSVYSVAYSPDGAPGGGRIVSGSGDQTVRVWDAETGRELTQLTSHTGSVNSVAYSPDGAPGGGRIVGGSEYGTVWVWDAETGQTLTQLTGHTDDVLSVAYSPDGSRIVSSSEDRTVRVWDAETGQELTQLTGHTDRVLSVAYSPDGSHIVGGSQYRTVWVWDLALAAADTWQALTRLTGHTGRVSSVVYSPDGSRIVSGGGDGTVRVWDVEIGQELFQLTGHTGSVNSVAYSPDGSRIVSGSDDQTVRVWDAETGQELIQLTGHTGSVNSVAYSPDGGRIVSGGEDGTVRVWFGDIEALLELADSLIQRDSPIFLGDERIRFGFDEQPAREH